jgi:hypothetical protein
MPASPDGQAGGHGGVADGGEVAVGEVGSVPVERPRGAQDDLSMLFNGSAYARIGCA